jgi:flagellar biosynthesis/type III secretory pathway protein FliH
MKFRETAMKFIDWLAEGEKLNETLSKREDEAERIVLLARALQAAYRQGEDEGYHKGEETERSFPSRGRVERHEMGM